MPWAHILVWELFEPCQDMSRLLTLDVEGRGFDASQMHILEDTPRGDTFDIPAHCLIYLDAHCLYKNVCIPDPWRVLSSVFGQEEHTCCNAHCCCPRCTDQSGTFDVKRWRKETSNRQRRNVQRADSSVNEDPGKVMKHGQNSNTSRVSWTTSYNILSLEVYTSPCISLSLNTSSSVDEPHGLGFAALPPSPRRTRLSQQGNRSYMVLLYVYTSWTNAITLGDRCNHSWPNSIFAPGRPCSCSDAHAGYGTAGMFPFGADRRRC